MTSEKWYTNSNDYNIKGNSICVKESKNTDLPTLLLLHGFPTCSYDWFKMWPLLKDYFHLVTFDFLGFGKSDKPFPHNYTIEEQATITTEVLDELRISKCHIIAHNYAVSVVQELIARLEASEHPLAIGKIILLNGGLFPETHRARPIQKLLLSPLGRLAVKMLSKNSLRKNLRQVFGPETPPTDEEIDELWKLIKYNKGKRVFYLLIRYILDRRRNRERWVNAMHQSTIPIRLVNGPMDPVSGRHMADRYCEIFEDADVVFLERIGHYPNIEAPEQVASQAISYFKFT